MHLKHGAVLQGGKYRIEKLLGQGGFGITYLAVQTGLDRKVAIKEFFMKEHCNREADTSHVSVPSVGSRELVAQFKEKFIKEARMIAGYDHSHIVSIYDNFEENGTAYYVMKYYGSADGSSTCSLAGLPLPLSCEEAVGYVRQISSALSYLHARSVMHLDIKPSNVLIDGDGNAVLIDFGVSKRYDQAGHQTSSTPVGVSKGYAPIEQYSQSTLEFNPATDIYSLGATLCKFLTGDTPPEASLLVSNPKLLIFPSSVSEPMAALIRRCMSPSLAARPQSISEFLGLLDEALAASTGDETKVDSEDDATTVIFGNDKVDVGSVDKTRTPSEKKKSRRWLWWLLAAVMLAVAGVAAVMSSRSGGDAAVASSDVRAVPQHELDMAAYDSLMTEVSSITLDDIESCNKAIKLYEEALVYEEKYVATEYRSMFSEGASEQILIARIAAEKFEAEAEAQKAKAEQERKQYEAELKVYNGKMDDADKKSRSDEKSLKEAKKLYEEAAKYETRYKGTEYASSFVKGAAGRAKDMQILIDNMQKSKPQPAPSPSPKTSGSSPIASTTGTYNGHEWVDLGLSVKWATCNVGASTPGDYGNYYAWGDISSKSSYTRDNSASYGKFWSDIGGNSNRDAARANWGGSWRMPTKAECQELKDNCTWTRTTQNGHNGYRVTGKNGQSIFLPAAGWHGGGGLSSDGEYGGFWSSTPDESNTDSAYRLYFGKVGPCVYWDYRYFGQSVRPVLGD